MGECSFVAKDDSEANIKAENIVEPTYYDEYEVNKVVEVEGYKVSVSFEKND